MTPVMELQVERRRQVVEEGWTPDHDDKHVNGELAKAAAAYAVVGNFLGSFLLSLWPWDSTWFKPTTKRRNLVKAGALILAEIERLDRAAGNSEI